jgi:hypothetical protein
MDTGIFVIVGAGHCLFFAGPALFFSLFGAFCSTREVILFFVDATMEAATVNREGVVPKLSFHPFHEGQAGAIHIFVQHPGRDIVRDFVEGF